MAIKVVMPEMGEGVIEGTISRWLKNIGDKVEKYEPILEIETDKVTTEATAEASGTLLQIYVKEGETVAVGTLLAYIGEADEEIPQEDQEIAGEAQPAMEGISRAKSTNGSAAPTMPYSGRISPVVGRIASEHKVDLGQVEGTGLNGRITKKDILAYIEQRESSPFSAQEPRPVLPPQPTAPSHPPNVIEKPHVTAQPVLATIPGETVPLTSMRRSIAEHMVRSKHTSPHVTTVFEFDFSAVSTHRAIHKEQFAKDGGNLTFTVYMVAAIIQALKKHPMANSSWSDEGIILKREINIGMATAIPEGLIVPVIKNADGMNLLGLSRTINDLAKRARNNQLLPGDVQGGTFTLTNHGVTGSLLGTPIINQPQCGILGMGKIEKRVKVIDDAIAIRPLAYISFTFDHRILDGATADYFVNSIKESIENWG